MSNDENPEEEYTRWTLSIPSVDGEPMDAGPASNWQGENAKENTEVALSFMWCKFGQWIRLNGGPSDIHWAAAEFARDGLRRRIFEYFGTGKDLGDFTSDYYPNQLRVDWEETARKCLGAGQMIEVDHMVKAWTGGYDDPRMLGQLDERGAGIISGSMWYRFAVGSVRTGITTEIPTSVIEAGHGLSGDKVHASIRKYCIPGSRLDLTRWDHEGISVCSYSAGRWAAAYAMDNFHRQITSDDFTRAWYLASRLMGDRKAAMIEAGLAIVSNAC